MKEEYQRLSRIENFFSMLLTNKGISDNIFVGDELPAALDKDWDTMVLIEVARMTAYNAFTQGSANVYLFARPTDTSLRKPTHVLDEMEEALNNAIVSSHNDHYAVKLNWRDTGYDSQRNLYYNIVNVGMVSK